MKNVFIALVAGAVLGAAGMRVAERGRSWRAAEYLGSSRRDQTLDHVLARLELVERWLFSFTFVSADYRGTRVAECLFHLDVADAELAALAGGTYATDTGLLGPARALAARLRAEAGARAAET